MTMPSATAVIESTPRPSVSTWALHPLLGKTFPGRPGDPDAFLIPPAEDAALDLLDVPAALAARGFHTMELCHFHLPSREDAYLGQFRAALDDAGVELWSLLIDDGDVTHPEHGGRDANWIRGWLDTAGSLGARCARVIAGKQEPTAESLGASRERLLGLAVEAYVRGMRLMTENWFALLARPEYVDALLSNLNGMMGLCLDFGNWSGPTKYEDLAAIAPRAESCHAKCQFREGEPDEEDFARCLALLVNAGYLGPYTLVHGEPGDVWGSLQRQRDLLVRCGAVRPEVKA